MSKKEITSNELPNAVGPYSHAIVVGNMLYTSGQIPIDANSGAICGSAIKAQTKQAIKNLNAVLSAAGVSADSVVKTTVFLADMNDFADFNEIYAQNFNKPYPARSCVQVARLPKDVLVEIEAIAVLD